MAIPSASKISLALLGVALLAWSGCGPRVEPWGEVTGQVTFDGKPAFPVVVLFAAPERGIEMTTVTDERGDFRIVAAKNAGLPTGDYRIGIYPARYEQPVNGMTFPKDGAKSPNSEVPSHFRDPKTSGLTATVKEGANRFAFELK